MHHRPAVGNYYQFSHSFIDEQEESSKKQKEQCRLGKEGHVSVCEGPYQTMQCLHMYLSLYVYIYTLTANMSVIDLKTCADEEKEECNNKRKLYS